jgi:hypothetical protein
VPGGTDRLLVRADLLLEGWFRNAGGLWWWVVFGTLLGPEATGPGLVVFGCGGFRVCLFLVSWLHRSCMWMCGVCGLGLLFENYIVDASIFYKKQFPRNMNLDLAAAFWLWLVFVVLSKNVF